MPDGVHKLLSFLRKLIDSPKNIVKEVEKLVKCFMDLKTEDVKARGKFQICLQELNELVVEVELYIGTIMNRPTCTKERIDAIILELSRDQSTRFDVKNEDRFPRTISFLYDLDLWGKRAEKHYQKFNKMCKEYFERTQEIANAEQAAAKASKAEKNETIKAWVNFGLTIGIIGGAITGGASLLVLGAAAPIIVGGIALGTIAGAGAGVGTGAGAGVIASSDDRRDESTHNELSKKCFKSNEKAGELQFLATEYNKISESPIVKGEKDVIFRHENHPDVPMPIACDLKQSFVRIFEVINSDLSNIGNLSELKRKIEKMSTENVKK